MEDEPSTSDVNHVDENERIAKELYEKTLAENSSRMGCADCLMVFDDALMYEIHRSAHDPTHSLTCVCGQVFPNRHGFTIHVMLHPHPRDYQASAPNH